MANREKGEFRVKIGPDEYTLKLGFNALCEIEDRLGWAIQEWQQRTVNGQIQLKDLRLIVWGAMLKYHAGRTVEQVGDLLDDMDGAQMNTIVNALWGVTNADPEDVKALEIKGDAGDADPNPPAAQPGTGEDSTASLVGSV